MFPGVYSISPLLRVPVNKLAKDYLTQNFLTFDFLLFTSPNCVYLLLETPSRKTYLT